MNEKNEDPRFVNPQASDFRLGDTSSAIDAGTSDASSVVNSDYLGVSRPQGSEFDIGAYENN